jgi:hypothetical protein
MATLDSLTPSVQSLSRDQFLSMCGVAFDDALELAPPESPYDAGDFAEALAVEVRERLYSTVGCGGGHFLREVNHVG